MTNVMSPTSVAEALEMLRSAMGYLAAADATAMTAEEQAQCLRVLESVNSVGTAARTSVLSAFTSGQGYSADADYSPRAWLIHKTGVTKGAAVAYTAWVRRAAEHPQVLAALTAEDLPESVARILCQWTNQLPKDRREDADRNLIAAAVAGMDLRGLAELYGEMYEQSRSETPDEDKDEAFDDRAVRLLTTFQGAGVMTGDLTPECAEAVQAVLDALSAPVGAEDTRTHPQRYHDALQEAMRRLVAAGLLPERAGQPVKVWAHISLADLLRLDGSSALQEEWTAQVRAQWAGHRAAASEGAGSDGAWLDGDAAEAIACDAAVAPIVTGDVNPAALEDLVRLCTELHRLRHADADADADADAARRRCAGRPRPGYRPRLGSPRASRHRQGRRPALRPWRPSELPAPPPARRAAGRSQPAPRHWVQRDHPGRDPQRGDPAGQALPVGGPLRPARRRLPGAPHPAQGQRRPDIGQGLRAAVLVPPPSGDPSMGLDPGLEPRRDHHGVEQGQDQGLS